MGSASVTNRYLSSVSWRAASAAVSGDTGFASSSLIEDMVARGLYEKNADSAAHHVRCSKAGRRASQARNILASRGIAVRNPTLCRPHENLPCPPAVVDGSLVPRYRGGAAAGAGPEGGARDRRVKQSGIAGRPPAARAGHR